MIKKVKNLRIKKATKVKEDLPFEKRNEILPLKLMIVIVDHGQGEYFLNGFSELNVSCSLSLLGKGTAPKELYDVLGFGSKKDIVIGIVKENELEKIKDFIKNRFNVSKKAKGVAFSIKINSIVGVLIYKFLTNTRNFK